MLKNLSLSQASTKIVDSIVESNCKNRIKPMMLSGVKTEALLVFSRTALERFFTHIEENNLTPKVGSADDTDYVYSELKKLKNYLQEFVVNADYLIDIVQGAKQHQGIKEIAKHEEPLIDYYDAMAKKVSSHFNNKPAYIPEFLVVCVLSNWIIEEEKSIQIYPFLNEIDFETLIDKFESNRAEFQTEDECVVSDIFKVSSSIIDKLKNKKYKLNKTRVSKTRKKR